MNRSPDSDKETGYGVGGIAGWKPDAKEWLGYETTTVGPAGNVLNRLNTQNGLQSADPMVMAAREPFRVGRFLVKWLKAPPFFQDMAVKYLRWIFEDMVMEVSGVPENSLEKIDIQNGAVQATTSYPGMYRESGNSVTLKVRECAGSPVRKFLDYWISAVSDRKTGVCHLYGAKMRAVLPNMAGSIIYVLLGPTCRPEDIEFSCMWHEIMPYSEKSSHMNSGGIGDAGSGVDMDIEFSGQYDRGPEIDLFARKIVEGYNLYGQSYLNQLLPSYMYDPTIYEATGDQWKAQNSVDIEARLDNAIVQSEEVGETAIYSEALRDKRAEQFEPYFSRFKQGSTAENFGTMGIMVDGQLTTIQNRTEIADSITGSN
ncbi:MAG: hypothetical protein ACRC5M_04680 [Anaeroplasmataceae bacterium]